MIRHAGGEGHDASCREMAESVSAYLDGDLDAALKAAIEKHEGKCPPCRAFIRTLATTVEAIRKQPREPLPESLRSALRQALEQLKAREGESR